MNKKFLSAILFGALMVTSTGTFVSCKDYDDDIDQINTELDGLKDQIAALQSKINSGEWVSGVTSTADGVTITLGNGQTFNIKNGKDGAPGAAGAAGAAGSVITIDPTTNNWLIDGVDTGVCAKGQDGTAGVGTPGLDGHSPKINEAGTWEVWNDETQAWEDTELSAIGAQTYVVEYTSYYELNVMEQDAEGENVGFVKINLPKTAAITNLEAVTITDGKIGDAEVTLNYGITIADGSKIEFNGKTYTAGTTLLSAGSSLSAIVNPQNADASVYEFALVDSKGNAPYVISGVKANATEAALSRAATANNGVWDMSVAYAEGVDFSKAAERSAAAYALTTTTYAGTIASAYDVKVTEAKVGTIAQTSSAGLSVDINKDLDLTTLFKEKIGWTLDGTAQVENGKNKSLMPYIVDYYFKLGDQTQAATYGVELNGNTIRAAKKCTYVIKYGYLTVSGKVVESLIPVTFKYVAPTTELTSVAWEINADSKKVYLPISSIQSSLIGSSDNAMPSTTAKAYAWADGKKFTEKTVEINGVKYGKDGTAINNAWVATVTSAPYAWDAQNNKYVAATSIQQDLFVEFVFDNTVAMPGEYTVTLGFKKNGASDNTLEVPVNVTITAPTTAIVKHENYFTDNNAVAYGEADGTVAKYDLTQLFKTTGLSFAETEVKNAQGVAYTKWLNDNTKPSTISVPVYSYAQNADNTVSVYSSHEFTASIIPFNNAHIQKTEYKFNLTVKSAIKEGEFTTTASKTISTSEGVRFSVSDFNGVDVFGDKFYLGKSYKYNTTTKKYDVATEMDTRIQSVAVVAANDYATDYLNFETTFAGADQTTGVADGFKVTRKSGLTQLVQDTECQLKVVVVDNWGVKSEAIVTVILKKF